MVGNDIKHEPPEGHSESSLNIVLCTECTFVRRTDREGMRQTSKNWYIGIGYKFESFLEKMFIFRFCLETASWMAYLILQEPVPQGQGMYEN